MARYLRLLGLPLLWPSRGVEASRDPMDDLSGAIHLLDLHLHLLSIAFCDRPAIGASASGRVSRGGEMYSLSDSYQIRGAEGIRSSER